MILQASQELFGLLLEKSWVSRVINAKKIIVKTALMETSEESNHSSNEDKEGDFFRISLSYEGAETMDEELCEDLIVGQVEVVVKASLIIN